MNRAYPALLHGALRHRVLVIATAVLDLFGAIALVPRLGVDLIPPFAQGEFSFEIQLPEGTPLEVTDRVAAIIGEHLADENDVESYSTIAGGAGLSLTSTGTDG